ncbi:septum formation family protein [Streptomyces sp. NPDC001513]|uniref:septum formation family protein n=1 Tax=Streptomyces sp. NPDC001513 TaxID=3364580 RepID=UPI0036B2263B
MQDIRKGDCFNTGGDLAEYEDEDGAQAGYSVKIVPCDQAHEGEAFAVFNLDDGAYPGKDKVVSIAEEKCSGTALTDYVGKNANVSDKLGVFYYYPQPSTWAFGDREVTCFVGDSSGTSTGSLRSAS